MLTVCEGALSFGTYTNSGSITRNAAKEDKGIEVNIKIGQLFQENVPLLGKHGQP